jgi:hypothetical protein
MYLTVCIEDDYSNFLTFLILNTYAYQK